MKNQNQSPKANVTEVKPVMEIVKTEQESKKSGLQNSAEDITALPVVQEIKPISLDELKRKVEMLTNLSKKHDDESQKLKRIENFAVLHDNTTAEILLKDANGETFRSHSPEAISKFIDVCKSEFNLKLSDIEKQMREIA